jgi:hypothetical protein
MRRVVDDFFEKAVGTLNGIWGTLSDRKKFAEKSGVVGARLNAQNEQAYINADSAVEKLVKTTDKMMQQRQGLDIEAGADSQKNSHS